MKRRIHTQLLFTTAISMSAAMLAFNASAADINVTTDPDTAAKTAAADNDRLVVNAGGNLVVTGSPAFSSANFDEVSILVNTGDVSKGISSNDVAADFEDASTSIGSIDITSGRLTSSSVASTLLINTAADTYTIKVGSGGVISNTGAGGEIIAMLAVNGNQNATIENAGVISGTNNAGTVGIRMYDDDGGSKWNILNKGSIVTGAAAIALGVETGKAGSNALTFTNSGSGSVVTGNISVAVGANDTADITNQGTITGDITGTAGTLTLSNSMSITGNVSTTAGYLNITGNTGTIGGNVSTGSGKLAYTGGFGSEVASISTVSGDEDIVLNKNAKVTNQISLGTNGGSTLSLNETSRVGGNVTMDNAGQTTTFNGGTVGGKVSGTGNIVIAADTVQENQFNITGNVTVNAGKTLNVATFDNKGNTTLGAGSTIDLSNGNHTLTGTLTGSGGSIFKLGTGTQTVSSSFTTGANDVLNLTINGTGGTNSGRIAAGTSDTSAGMKLNLTINAGGAYIADGTQYVIVDGSAGNARALTNDASQITVNGATSQFLSFNTTSIDSGHDLALNVARAAYRTIASTRNTDNVGDILNSLGPTATGNVAAFLTALDNTSTAQETTRALESVITQADNARTTGAYMTSISTANVISNRLSSMRAADTSYVISQSQGATSGVAAGNPSSGRALWMQGFGSAAEQGLRSGVTGYDADTYGFSIGGDTLLDERTRVGLSVSYANTDVDSHNAIQGTDIDTYQINLYGTREYGAYFAEGIAGFAYNQYDTTRFIPLVPATAQGDFDGQTYLARLTGGYKHQTHGFDIMPKAMLTMAHVTTEGYTETGAGGLNLTADSDSVNVLEPRVGVDVGYETKRGDTLIRPIVRASLGYDLLGESQSTNLRFAGTAPVFNARGANVAQTSLMLGAGLNILTSERFTFSADYDYELREDYSSHSGLLRVKYAF